MNIVCEQRINAPKDTVWQVITDWENCDKWIEGIEKVEILNKPEAGLVGLKWRETRTMMGKTATEDMWITEVKDKEYYDVRAESHGMVYLTRMELIEDGNGCILRWDFGGEAQSTGTKIFGALLGWMFKGATKKALAKDLVNIKDHAESLVPA